MMTMVMVMVMTMMRIAEVWSNLIRQHDQWTPSELDQRRKTPRCVAHCALSLIQPYMQSCAVHIYVMMRMTVDHQRKTPLCDPHCALSLTTVQPYMQSSKRMMRMKTRQSAEKGPFCFVWLFTALWVLQSYIKSWWWRWRLWWWTVSSEDQLISRERLPSSVSSLLCGLS